MLLDNIFKHGIYALFETTPLDNSCAISGSPKPTAIDSLLRVKEINHHVAESLHTGFQVGLMHVEIR